VTGRPSAVDHRIEVELVHESQSHLRALGSASRGNRHGPQVQRRGTTGVKVTFMPIVDNILVSM
jgi:hypothetical protein